MADSSQATARSRRSPLLLIIAAALVAAAAAGGGVWFFTSRQHAPAAPAEAARPPAAPLYTALDPITVNLQDARGERYAQVAITLQIEDAAIEKRIKDHLPSVRNDILLLVASKQIDELISAEGKQKLAEEIRARTARAIGMGGGPEAEPGRGHRNPISHVLFSQFIVQ